MTLDRSQLASAQEDLAGAKLTAPFSGRVAEVSLSVGDTVGSGGGATGGTGSTGGTSTGSTDSSGITVISKSTFTVDTWVSYSDVTSIKNFSEGSP